MFLLIILMKRSDKVRCLVAGDQPWKPISIQLAGGLEVFLVPDSSPSSQLAITAAAAFILRRTSQLLFLIPACLL
jgi:hypothetical protein